MILPFSSPTTRRAKLKFTAPVSIDGGSGGLDSVRFLDEGSASLRWDMTVDLSAGTLRIVDADDSTSVLVDLGADKLVSIEGFQGAGGDDTIMGTARHDILWGGGGDDTLRGGDGVDQLLGGAGDDVLAGGKGADTYVFREADVGSDTITDASAGNNNKNKILIDFTLASRSLRATNDDGDAVITLSSSEGAVKITITDFYANRGLWEFKDKSGDVNIVDVA